MYKVMIKGRFFRLSHEEFEKALMRNSVNDIEFVI